jgi:hypothetical protein
MSSSPIKCLKCGGTVGSIAAFKADIPGSIPGADAVLCYRF